ncbi:LLGL1 [Branchiostoma lanceolatum]|uniref:LLGL1 protein n=1 Tax=Branchiostoma lanceolatum TaxID=7740 RepID=A0A8J9VE17_BRALA|nr:LLGL1 [Branchiostoma lanceolatum]
MPFLKSKSLERTRARFGFTRAVEHGFPHRPSSMAYDPKLKLFAIVRRIGRHGALIHKSQAVRTPHTIL